MSKIEQRTVISVMLTNDGATPAVFTGTLPLSFKPDEMIIRQVVFNPRGGLAGLNYVVSCDAVPDQILCTFAGDVNSSIAPMTRFNLREFQQSRQVTFQIQSATSNIVIGPCSLTDSVDGQLNLMLEFIKFK